FTHHSDTADLHMLGQKQQPQDAHDIAIDNGDDVRRGLDVGVALDALRHVLFEHEDLAPDLEGKATEIGMERDFEQQRLWHGGATKPPREAKEKARPRVTDEPWPSCATAPRYSRRSGPCWCSRSPARLGRRPGPRRHRPS